MGKAGLGMRWGGGKGGGWLVGWLLRGVGVGVGVFCGGGGGRMGRGEGGFRGGGGSRKGGMGVKDEMAIFHLALRKRISGLCCRR